MHSPTPSAPLSPLPSSTPPQRLFVTGIGTDVGKTVAAAVLVQALGADYWKPVQAGGLDFTDSDTVRSLVSNSASHFHPERHRLQMPASPHRAAAAEGITIQLNDFRLPATNNHLVVEGAGGLLVPLAPGLLVADLVKHLGLGVVVVSRHYLGSINHTLLTLEVLRQRGIPLRGLVFNGDSQLDAPSEEAILHHTPAPVLFRLQQEVQLNAATVARYAEQVQL
ncbi:ATP-dependent dethiobiotin synthetase BioD [Solirubrum puertoriconensis]|uniref:ATP-dependent dethiobiotin synthetase BioD n=1 Tax=Solirubrum puertoriconensis TaxID=1751427 RepID=A0A9X0HJU0_SOLP1|nr:ATP-dependent dethiobiotin synthetase BioD [Solirubrum puertoriconensis]